MSWLSDRLTELLQDRGVSVQTVARELAIERSHLTKITSGVRTPNENLTRRLAAYFGEDPDLWVGLTITKPDPPAAQQPSRPSGFVKVATLADIRPGDMIMVVDDTVAIANVNGELYAFGNDCPHAGGPLGDGFLVDHLVECPFHAGRWDVRTGAAKTALAPEDIPVYELRVDGDDIEIKLA